MVPVQGLQRSIPRQPLPLAPPQPEVAPTTEVPPSDSGPIAYENILLYQEPPTSSLEDSQIGAGSMKMSTQLPPMEVCSCHLEYSFGDCLLT